MKELMKITSASFGFGGYDGAMFGLSIGMQGPASGCGDFWGSFPAQLDHFGEHARRISELLKSAKVESVNELIGKPIEATFDDSLKLISWRILTEVL